jgi:WD40 repeat protein
MSALIAVTSLLLQCDDAPTKPHVPQDDIIYINTGPVADTVGGFHVDSTYGLLRYHMSSGIFDSVRISLPSRLSMATSPDGRQLYLGLLDNVLVLDTRSWDTLAILPYARTGSYESGLAVSPNGRYLAVCQNLSTISCVRILRTSDYSVVFADSGAALGTQLDAPYFSPDNRYFVARGSAGIYMLDLQSRPPQIVDQYLASEPLQTGRHDRRWYYTYGWGSRIYDTDGDSVIYSNIPGGGGSAAALSADEHYLFYVYLGSFWEPSPDKSIHVMDLTNGYALSSIPTDNLTDQNGVVYPVTLLGNKLIVSPDGRKLLVGGNLMGAGWLILDIPTMRIEKFYSLQMFNFTCQRAQ